MNTKTMEDQIRSYIAENLVFTDTMPEIEDDESLLDSNIVDSVAVMELVMFVEESYGLDVQDYEIVPDNFDSIARIANYVRSKRKAA